MAKGQMGKLEMLTLGGQQHNISHTSDGGNSTPPSTTSLLGLDGVAPSPCNKKKQYLRIHTDT